MDENDVYFRDGSACTRGVEGAGSVMMWVKVQEEQEKA